MSEHKVYTPAESKAIIAGLDVIKAEVVSATLTSPILAADPLAPTPFSPSTSALDDALSGFQPLPYSEEEVKALIGKIMKAAETESRIQKFSERANVVIQKLTGLVPLLFGV